MFENIEFVCSGNRGRTPLAVAFAKKVLFNRGILEEISLISSGARVSFFDNGSDKDLAGSMLKYVPKALKQGVITESQARDLKNGNKVKEIRKIILDEINRREIEQKEFLRKKGVFDLFEEREGPKQTVFRKEAELICVFGEDNFNFVKDLYANKKTFPKIELIQGVEDIMLATQEEYELFVNSIEKAVVGIIKRYFGEISSR